MVNLISNSCVGAYITTLCLDQPYVNPFCWNIIDFNSFKNLIEHYNTIDFKNIKLILNSSVNKYTLVIDDKVSVLYEHYINAPSFETLVKKNCNVYWKDIDKYITDKYFSRLKLDDKPVFMAGSSWINGTYSCEEYKKLIEVNANRFRLINIVNSLDAYNELKELENDKNKIYLTNLVKNNKKLSLDVFEEYKDFIVQ